MAAKAWVLMVLGCAAALPAVGAAQPASGAAVAVDATAAPIRLPASVTLDYRVKAKAYGLPFGTTAQLVWRRDGMQYHAEWDVQVPILGERRQRSNGTITPNGLAPVTYTEQVKTERSAQFDYAAKRIRFSDGTPEGTLAPGTQDRLTVSLQLGALLAAAPKRYPAGSVITVPTAGVRHVELWQWDVVGDETLLINGQEIPCVKLKRRARHADDSKIDIWLARTLDYLPARMRVQQKRGEEVDQMLRDVPKLN